MDTPDEPQSEPQRPDEEPTREQQEPKRLYRSRDDRVLAGVCGGLARYFGIDAAIFRVAAVVLVLVGGAGALAYVAAALLIPDDPQGQPAGAGGDGSRTVAIVLAVVVLVVAWPLILGGGLLAAGLLVPLAVLALCGLLTWWLVSGESPSGNAADVLRRAGLGTAVLVGCCFVFFAGAWAAAAGGGAVAAGIVIAAGVALVIGAFVGRVRWLIPPVLAVALAVGFVAAADIDLDGGVGDREYRPTSAAQLRDEYELGMGELVVDLRGTRLPQGDTPLKLDVGVGEAAVIVPENVCVASKADIGMGGVKLFDDDDNGGIDFDWDDQPRAPAGTSRVVVDADVGVGALRVSHEERDGDHDHGFKGFGNDDDDDETEAEEGDDDTGNAACSGRRTERDANG